MSDKYKCPQCNCIWINKQNFQTLGFGFRCINHVHDTDGPHQDNSIFGPKMIKYED